MIGGAAAKGIEYVTTVADNVNRSTYTFAATDMGDAKPNKYILLIVHENDVLDDVTGVTVGGNAATLLFTYANSTRFFVIADPGTATADIVVSMDGTGQQMWVHVLSLFGVSSTTPHDTDTPASFTDPNTATIDIPSDGIVVAFAREVGTGTGTFSWSGGTLSDADEVYDGDALSGTASAGTGMAIAAKSGLGAATGASITTTTDGGQNHGTVVASWT